MKITDIIRGVLDIIDGAEQQEQPTPELTIAIAEPSIGDELTDLKSLAGIECDSRYANAPYEMVAPTKAAFPGGDDVHQKKNPADIRTNAPSMYPGYQAGGH